MYPVLPLRDVVVYPHMVIPLFVGRQKSIQALSSAMADDKRIILVTQKEQDIDDPGEQDIHAVGTEAKILQMLKIPDGTLKVLVEGVARVTLADVEDTEEFLLAKSVPVVEIIDDENSELSHTCKSALDLFEQFIKLNKKTPAELLDTLTKSDDASRIADTIAAHIAMSLNDRQEALEQLDVQQRLEDVAGKLSLEIEELKIENRVRSRVKKQMEKNQREYFLNEQMKAIQKELGDGENGESETDALKQKIEAAGMPKEAKEKAMSELAKLGQMSPMSAEASVVRNYLDTLIQVPWSKRSKIRRDLQHAEKILDADHCGLEKVKERILEFLAVQQRVKKVKGPILCLVGPPGVGKTSLGQSIARATNRKFSRLSLGGVRDESEIRGHRRTYIGSMPGKIIQKLSKIETKNPLMLLDELDKMGMDMRGDPASALLEVLDPEQNNKFSDHYLEVDYDLSEVMFVATANTLDIPAPLLDRMEVIRLPGYIEQEKHSIAIEHLLPKQQANSGLKKGEIEIADSAIFDIIRYYTREAGVRGLEREIAKINRKVVKQILTDKPELPIVVDSDNLEKYLGARQFRIELVDEHDSVGLVTGLAWTQVGGEVLKIEAVVTAGKGKLVSTGKLGDVMQESIQAALTVVTTRCADWGFDVSSLPKKDIHVHLPEGATPKDGPSAGIGVCTALLSALLNVPVKRTIAMTGEVTLLGDVLPIGGLKEKLLAAHRSGIKEVLIPLENEKDLKDVPDDILKDLEIIAVKSVDEVFRRALVASSSSSGAEMETGAALAALSQPTLKH